jgi:hypothetical protein
MTIVTRESLQAMLDNQDPEYVKRVVGRALVAIFNNQTEDEKTVNNTEVNNGIGFSGADARSGTLTAKTFLKQKTLNDWQVQNWTKRGKNGFSRLTKYSKQLNAIAEMRK